MNRSFGYSLVELTVAMMLGISVILMSVTLFSTTSKMGAEHVQSDFLQIRLNQIVNIMADEISRAGFCYTCQTINPYILFDDIQSSLYLIDDSANQMKAGSCIRFAYNEQKSINPIQIELNDAKGFRLGKNAQQASVIEIYENYSGLSNWTCSSGYWRDLTTDAITITKLEFKRNTYQILSSKNSIQHIQIEISAFLTANPKLTKTIRVVVRPQNVLGNHQI